MASFLAYIRRENLLSLAALGVVLFITLVAGFIWQVGDGSAEATDNQRKTEVAVLVLHCTCGIFTFGEGLIPSLGGRNSAYSSIVISTGFAATLFQLSIVAQFDDEYFWRAIGLSSMQIAANSLQLSFLFREVAKRRDESEATKSLLG